MDTAIMRLTTKAEAEINKVLQDFIDPWNLDKASLWVMNATGSMIMKQQNGDVYDLLDSKETLKSIKNADFFSILTCGWAAPIEKDITELEGVPPSKHPMKRRVRLVVGADITGVASVLRFADKEDEIVTDDGKARGSLADAVNQLVVKKLKLEAKESK